MNCTICSITNRDLKNRVENILLANDGFLSSSDKANLMEEFPNDHDAIKRINDADCELHFNFHQASARVPVKKEIREDSKTRSNSITDDIDKDEAEILYELANKQAGTFNLLTKRVNAALQDNEQESSQMLLHPTIIQLYHETAQSIRETISSIKELNSSINGSSNSFEGLKALASALAPNVNISTVNDAPGEMCTAEPKELTTDKFDY